MAGEETDATSQGEDHHHHCHHGANFDHAADDYDERAQKRMFRFHESVVEQIKKRLPPNNASDKTLFEFGSGTGSICLSLAPHFQHVYGVDISAKMLEKAQEKIDKQSIPNATVRQLDLKEPKQLEDQLQFPSKYDWVVCCMALHHVVDPMAKLELFHDLLNTDSGGKLAIVDFGASPDGKPRAHSHHHHHHGHQEKEEEKDHGSGKESKQTPAELHSAHHGHHHEHGHHHHDDHPSKKDEQQDQVPCPQRRKDLKDQYGIFTDGFDPAKLKTALEALGLPKFDVHELPPMEGMDKDHPFYGLPIVVMFASAN